MLPSLNMRVRRFPRLARWRAGLAGAGLLLAAGALLSPIQAEQVTVPRGSLAARLPASTWALAVPTTWFAAPLSGLREGDRVDVLALKASERPTAAAIAHDLEVMSIDERTVVLAVGAFDATAITTARAGGQLIVPLLRSER